MARRVVWGVLCAFKVKNELNKTKNKVVLVVFYKLTSKLMKDKRTHGQTTL
jgi:hypothetical protein